MKILTGNINLLKRIGITAAVASDANHKLFIKLGNLLCIVCPSLLLLPSFAYFVTYLEDVTKATNALYMMGILSMCIATYVFYSTHRCDVEAILQGLQAIVDSS